MNIFGILAMIPAIINRDIPFPSPFCVIWSPIHNKNDVPAVKINAVYKYVNVSAPFKKANDIANPCKKARPIPKYLFI